MGCGGGADRGGPFGVAGLGERRRLAGTMCVICGGGYMRSLGERRRLAGTTSVHSDHFCATPPAQAPQQCHALCLCGLCVGEEGEGEVMLPSGAAVRGCVRRGSREHMV